MRDKVVKKLSQNGCTNIISLLELTLYPIKTVKVIMMD